MNLIKPFKLLIFLVCFSFVVYQCVQCVQKYLDEPKGIDLSMEDGTGEIFPDFTFCSKAHNLNVLKKCGIPR